MSPGTGGPPGTSTSPGAWGTSRTRPTARTTPAHQPNCACGHCAPALRAGALLACPDAQRALLKPFLTSPPPSWNRGGEVRNSSKARPVRPAGQRGETNGETLPPSPQGSPDGFPPHPPSLALSWPTQGTPGTGRHPAGEEQTGGTGYRVSSACGLHLPRSAWHTTALAAVRGRNIRPCTPKPRCHRSPRGLISIGLI